MTADVEREAEPGGGAFLGGRYDVGRVLGTGATSEVRSGWDRRLERAVAIKLLRPELCADPLVRLRFAEEARAAGRLSHPNIVAVFDTGEAGADGPPFIVMEKLGGDTLRTAMEAGALPVPEVRRLAEQMLSALGAGVKAGVVHCDIKPGNILAAGEGVWKLADFGVASSLALARHDDTVADMVMGTPAYLAPERLCGHPATESSDLFALGIVLYEALCGVRPYRSIDSFPWSTALSGEAATPVRSLRPDVEPVLAAVIDRSIELDPIRRFATAGEMAAALDANRPARSRRRSEHPHLSLRRLITGTTAVAAALTASLLFVTAGGTARPARAGTQVAPSTSTTAPVPLGASSTVPDAPAPTAALSSTAVRPAAVPAPAHPARHPGRSAAPPVRGPKAHPTGSHPGPAHAGGRH